MATNNINKLTFAELCDYLSDHHDKYGVIVYKQNPTWRKEFSEQARSYRVSGNCNHFHSGLISRSIFGECLDGSEGGVRLDHYMWDVPDENKWRVDYCYVE